jgi:hypothetical protein
LNPKIVKTSKSEPKKFSRLCTFNVTVVYMAHGRNNFDAGNIHMRGPLEGVDPEMATSEASAIWSLKKSILPE